MSRSGAKRAKTPREIEGIPGTVEHGFREQPIIETKLPQNVIEHWLAQGLDPSKVDLRRYMMGPCNILVGREPAGKNYEKLWHMTISTPSRHPTWDEMKVARYRLLPHELVFAIMLPPPQYYVNVPEQDHVFQLWEITDPREQWTTG